MGDGADMDGGQPQQDYQQGYQPGDYIPRGPQYGHQQAQYVPPEPQYAQPQYQQPQYVPPPQPRRPRRRSSKMESKLALLHCFDQLMATPIFDDPSDPAAAAVQEELFAFAQRRIDELMGEASPKQDSSFTPEEAAALKLLAKTMLSPDEAPGEEAPAAKAPAAAPQPPPAPRPPPPPPPPVRGPRGCANPGCQFPPHGPEYPCSNAQPPQQPAPRPQQPRPAPQPPPPPQAPTEGPRVVQRPTAAQRQALEAARSRPGQFVPPPQAPIPQQVVHAPVRATRRGKKGQPAPVAPTGPPAPHVMRYPMPQGSHMTLVTGMKAEEAIAAGGTVMSETFVKSR